MIIFISWFILNSIPIISLFFPIKSMAMQQEPKLMDLPYIRPMFQGISPQNRVQNMVRKPYLHQLDPEDLPLIKWALPSGKRLHNHGKSPFFMGKSTISMAIFYSKLLVYQAGEFTHRSTVLQASHRAATVVVSLSHATMPGADWYNVGPPNDS